MLTKGDPMKFSVLGTKAGGPPVLGKNFASTLLWLHQGYILFDCGEGTQYRLLELGIAWNAIKVICISHFHGDHLWGLLPLLSACCSTQRKSPLTIIAPQGIRAYVEQSALLSGMTFPFTIEYIELPTNYSSVVGNFSGCRITATMVDHRIDSFGFRIDFPVHYNIDMEQLHQRGFEEGAMIGTLKSEGHIYHPVTGEIVYLSEVLIQPPINESFVYCGDTRPCAAEIDLARHATVLVHEATFLHQDVAAAYEKHHTTARQAAEIALQSCVSQLWITHVSNRYPQSTILLEEARSVFPQTFLANALECVEV